MSELKIRLPKPFPGQQKILSNAKRFNVIAGGEKSGKTTLGVEVLLASPRGALSNTKPVAWFSPTKEDVDAVRRQVKQAINPAIKRQVNSRRIELINGNCIDFYSFDQMPNAFPQYGLIVVDDARHVAGFLDIFDDTLMETLRTHEGQAWVFSGAFGKRNDFYRLFQRAGSDDWSAWKMPSESNPHLPEEIVAETQQVPESEYLQRFRAEFLDVAIELSVSQKVIRQGETFHQWCDRLAAEGLKVDGKPFTLDDRPAMAWIYDQVPSTVDEAFRLVLVLMKSAQVGFTILEMLAAIYLGLRFGPATVGMFLPDTNLADIKSSKRFMPVVRTIPEVHRLMTMEAADGSGRKQGEGNVRVRQIGEAMFVFSWTSGRATTESIPMDILSYDEVQEMTLDQMEKTQERLSASQVRFTLMGSTANWPDADIHHWYKRGSQHRFHTACPVCGSSKPLDDYFPACIQRDSVTGLYRYVCEHGHILDDTQAGEWIPDNPSADPPIDLSVPKRDRPLRIRSIHFPQFLSPTISAEEIIFAYNSATDMKNFYNRKLGKPYLDPSQVPVSLEHLANCVAAGKAAGVKWKTRAKGAYLGVDQMGNLNVCVIKERLPDGRQAVIHVEIVQDADPFDRCDQMMEQFDIAAAVVEINPNYNDAKKFANRWPGRVFICNSFGSIAEGMIQWGDTPRMGTSDRRTSDEAQDRYTLKMDQYKCMQVSMSRFTSDVPTCLFPDPQGLVQEITEKGQAQLKPVLPIMFNHFTKTALVAEKDEETNQYKRSVKKIGIDPHFSYANMLCDVAWARSHGTSTFFIPDNSRSLPKPINPADVGVPSELAALVQETMDAAFTGDVCGRCTSRDAETGLCSENGALVGKTTPGCWAFVAKS